MYGEEEFFKLYRVVGKNTAYKGMETIDVLRDTMNVIGHSPEEIDDTIITTEKTLMLRGLQNKKLFDNLLNMPIEKMKKILEGQNIRVVLRLKHESKIQTMNAKIDEIGEILIERIPRQLAAGSPFHWKNMKKINKLKGK